MIQITEIQRDFLMRACNLDWAVLQYDITDKDFVEDYGYTKEQARNEIENLYNNIK